MKPKFNAKAYCYRDGSIHFTVRANIPAGAILICTGDDYKKLREEVIPKARRSYAGKPLVPGVPEAQTDADALSALRQFVDWIDQCRNHLAHRAASGKNAA